MPRGKKSCPKCNALVGPRLRVCACGHAFAFKSKAEVEAPLRPPPKLPRKDSRPPQVEKPFENLSDDLPKVIVVTDRDEVRAFIQQLKSCYDRSNANGGGYAAFLHHKTGKLQVDVCLEMRIP